jgi:hypothetical protein
MLSTLGEIVRDLLLAVGLITVLLAGMIVVVMKMPAGNPLKRLLTALCFRLGATAAAAVLAIPIEPIPGLDVFYDIGAPILLLVYWISFFKNARWTSAPDTHGGTPPSMTGDRRHQLPPHGSSSPRWLAGRNVLGRKRA